MVNKLLNFLFEFNDTSQEPEAKFLSRFNGYNNGTISAQQEPRDCVLVLDCSGSMGHDDWPPNRLEGAKEASRSFCSRLASENPESRVAIVSYGSSATRHCKLTPVKRVAEIDMAIEGIFVSGWTNIRAGLSKARRILSGSNGQCQVVLLSDGENTARDPSWQARLLRRKAIIECVGIGGSPEDVDEQLMREIASEYPDGSKRYRWIGDKGRLVEHFQQLAGRISKT